MQINSIKHINNKCYLSITFLDEDEERIFLQKALNQLKSSLPINCMLTDLDTSYSLYEAYFNRDNYYVFDRLTTVSIFAFDLNETEVENVLSNWGYYTIDAVFALGILDGKVKEHRCDVADILKTMPVVISQVLDNSVDIVIEQCYYEEISNEKFITSILSFKHSENYNQGEKS